jgi:cysteinyl-tRNA synthetase
MFLYNTLTRKKEKFVPIKSDEIKIYSCGPTVYSDPHIGNFKSLCFSDILRWVLSYIGGYDVTHVMNITDVGHLVSDGDDGEDKMEKGAKKEGMTAREVAKKYEQRFRDAMRALRVSEFDVMPRATEHIAEQIALVQSLESKWYTYQIADGIYFDSSKLDDYGKLMGPNYKKNIENLRSGTRVDASGKKNATDFALRKFAKTEDKRDMERDSPRGKGFPGWHIECSAMSSKYLGNHFDIHVWGPEHINVHHSNEIAQSECGLDLHGASQRVNYWIHHGVLTVDGGKMSKSLGNGYTLDQLAAQKIESLDLRMFFLMAHYRSYQDFTWENLQGIQKARLRLRKKIMEAVQVNNFIFPSQLLSWTELKGTAISSFYAEVDQSFTDDMNLPQVLATINTMIANEPSKEDLNILYHLEKKIFKLDLFEPIAEHNHEIPQEVIALANQRLSAKADKDYMLADALRTKIVDLGFLVKDSADGFSLEKL